MHIEELINLVKHYADYEVSLSEIVEAYKPAKAKLERIIAAEGDAKGERRKPYYLAQLIEEHIRYSKMSDYFSLNSELKRKRDRYNQVSLPKTI